MDDQVKAWPKIFISHLTEDRPAAEAVARRLRLIEPRIEVFVAGSPKFEGPRFGRPINESLRMALGSTSVVLLLFTTSQRDWSYCCFECGIALDPNDDNPTNIVVLQLRGESPKIYPETLAVKMNDRESVLDFVRQFCTDARFFPKLNKPLKDWLADDDNVEEHAKRLFEELKPYTSVQEAQKKTRWGGFTVSLDADIVSNLKKIGGTQENQAPEPLVGDAVLLKVLLSNAKVSKPIESGLEHFDYAGLDADMTLAALRQRWLDGRGPDRVNNKPWTEVIAEELWRIVTMRPPRLKWEPFLSLRDRDLWLYPIVYQYHLHPDGRYDFDLLLIQTRSPRDPSSTGL
jgi:hypothetical protein